MRVRSRPALMVGAAALAALLLGATGASAQQLVSMPDTTQSTTFTASVAEQVTITVPAAVSFTVSNIANNVDAADASVTAANIVMSGTGKSLKISLKADAADFTPPVALSTTYAAADVSWNAPSWTNGTGASGTLSSAGFNEVVTCNADSTGCSTAALKFTLQSHPGVQYAGSHTLTATWKVESRDVP